MFWVYFHYVMDFVAIATIAGDVGSAGSAGHQNAPLLLGHEENGGAAHAAANAD